MCNISVNNDTPSEESLYILTMFLNGKASGIDHSQPDHIDHLKPKLSSNNFVIYVNCNLVGQFGHDIRPKQ